MNRPGIAGDCWPGGGGIDGQVTGGPTPPFNFGTDPSLGSFGIWIGVGATDCYKNYGGMGADYDSDLLVDECEHRLAYMFRPELMINPADGCPGGEPYWAARYFDDPQHIGWGQFVRIAYLPAYYRDCGSGSHRGDSELIVLTVAYNGATRHWEVTKVFLSAHFMNPNDNSDTFNWNDVTYPSGIPKSYPRVWVAKGKHANYRAVNDCGELYEGSTDTCTGNVSFGRFAVYKSHNIGGYNAPLVNCTISQNLIYYLNDREECFHVDGRRFRGWQGTAGIGDARDYFTIMNTYAFECWAWTGSFDPLSCFWGPYGSRY